MQNQKSAANKIKKAAKKQNAQPERKYIFVTGGVLSGVGKGITAASIGAILKAKGFNVSIQKCDPYLNVDAGNLLLAEHGECFVTHDGKETDLDLGHYERFLDFETTKYSSVLSGGIYQELIAKERSGGFKGKTVQMVPHFTGVVQDKIAAASKNSEVHIVEIGGTVGDYESLSYIEAIRLFANRVGRENCLYVYVVYVPWINTSKELKTKPAQNALKDLRGFGIIPDVVVCRTEKPAPRAICEKIAAFSGIDGEAVLNLPDIDSVYDVPFNVLKSGVLEILNDFLEDDREPDMSRWKEFSKLRSREWAQTVKVGLVAQDVGNEDAYISVLEALKAAAAWNKVNVEVSYVLDEEGFAGVDGLLCPAEYTEEEVAGKIQAAEYALAHGKPFLGLGEGLQMALVAAMRRGGAKEAGLEDVAEEREMRLGDATAKLVPGSLVAQIYGLSEVIERHRHKTEVRREALAAAEKGGVKVAGSSANGKLVEFVEAPEMKFFVATQGRAELKSRPLNPHPLFMEFIRSLK